jgi:hypothetical protein
VSLQNVRRQYAVGQGYFQAGDLFEDKTLRLRYVVDCGALTKYASRRDARIDAYLAGVGAKEPLDLLFISHAHADHLNGVERLLDGVKGLMVKTIVLPLLNVEDRLIAYARAASEDAMSADNSFYREFVVDPASSLARFNPDRIIFVEPGNRDGGAPFSRGPDDPGEGPGDSDWPLRGNEQLPWKFVGRGRIRADVDATAKVEVGVASVMPDTRGMVCAGTGTMPAWLLAPFVDPSVKAGAALFMKSLAAARGQTVAALKKWLRGTGNVEKLLTVHVSDLKTAYAAIHADLNVTSMCLFSGPVPTFKPPTSGYVSEFGTWTVSGPGKLGVAWLGTGDAALADKKRRSAFFKHFGSLLKEVLTLTLPHHGSEHNFDAALLDRIQPSFCVASADRFSSWRHPGTTVVQSVASTGRFLSVVTSNVESEVTETIVVN